MADERIAQWGGEGDEWLLAVLDAHTATPPADFCPECCVRQPCETASAAATALGRRERSKDR